jgi:hypothetical protein
MKKRKKEEKRVLFSKNRAILVMVVLLVVFLSQTLILAAAEGDPNNTLMQRWYDSALDRTDAKWLIFLMTAVILYVLLTMAEITGGGGIALLISIPAAFILTAYVTPDSVLGIIRSYNTLPLTIATILPLAVLFLATYVAVRKGSKSMMTFAWLFWLVYFFYNIMIWGVYLYNQYWHLQWPFDPEALAQMVNFPELAYNDSNVLINGAVVGYFWTALLVRIIISGLMTFFPDWIMNLAMRKSLGLDRAIFQSKLNKMKEGTETLIELGKKMEGINTS